MINENFVYLGLIFNFTGSLSYIIDVIKGKAKPNRVTWSLWALAPLVAFFAELGKGVGIQSLMTFMVGFGPLLVLFASFINKKSFWKITLFDIFCGALSLLGLVFWFILKEGNYAIIFSIIADGLAAIPTIVKSFKAPETESYFIFFASAISALITLLTIREWTLANFVFPLYILVVCLVLTFLIKLRLGLILKTYLLGKP
ncbi:hypothetical protein M1349_02995 [Patescibacteria group bacterium]|nr:hypothetical protein [Patescibacteria group bacterium]